MGKAAMWDLSMAEQWKFYKPPIRPSEAGLEIFGKYINEQIAQKGNDIKILILGSTPELRGRSQDQNLNVVSFLCNLLVDVLPKYLKACFRRANGRFVELPLLCHGEVPHRCFSHLLAGAVPI